MSEEPDELPADRRGFLKQASASLAIVSSTSQAKADESPEPDDSFFPESFWRDRMEPPEDGKRLGWFVDTRRCIGCHACEVSCKSENDVPLGNYIRQTFYKDVGEYPIRI